MRRIYIAGAYSGPDVITILDNMRRGMRLSTEVFLSGYAPFCPWHDFMYHLVLREGEQLNIDDYYRYSLAWLEAADAVLVVPGYEQSKGTAAEIAVAHTEGIPVFYLLDELKESMLVLK